MDTGNLLWSSAESSQILSRKRHKVKIQLNRKPQLKEQGWHRQAWTELFERIKEYNLQTSETQFHSYNVAAAAAAIFHLFLKIYDWSTITTSKEHFLWKTKWFLYNTSENHLFTKVLNFSTLLHICNHRCDRHSKGICYGNDVLPR